MGGRSNASVLALRVDLNKNFLVVPIHPDKVYRLIVMTAVARRATNRFNRSRLNVTVKFLEQ